MEQREFIVEAEAAGQRIDRFLSGEDTGLSAVRCKASWRRVMCSATAKHRQEPQAQGGDTILLEIPDAKPIEAVPQDIRWTSCTRTTTFWW